MFFSLVVLFRPNNDINIIYSCSTFAGFEIFNKALNQFSFVKLLRRTS